MKNLIFILILGGVILFFVKGNDAPVTITNTIIDTVYQQKTLTKYKKGDSIPFVVLDTIYKVDEVHDTIQIVNDYNKVKAYFDTLRLDSLQYIYVSDTISQNKILGRGYGGYFVQKIIRIETIKTIPSKNEVYLGILGDLRTFDNKVGIGGSIAIKTAKKALFTLSATTNQYSIGYYAKF